MSMQQRLQAGATRIIAKLGSVFTVYNTSGDSVYDPETGIITENKQTFTIMGVLTEFTQLTNGQSTNTNTQVIVGDKRFYCDASTAKIAGVAAAFVPNASTTEVVVGVVNYKVVNVKSVDPSGNNAIAYEFQLRK